MLFRSHPACLPRPAHRRATPMPWGRRLALGYAGRSGWIRLRPHRPADHRSVKVRRSLCPAHFRMNPVSKAYRSCVLSEEEEGAVQAKICAILPSCSCGPPIACTSNGSSPNSRRTTSSIVWLFLKTHKRGYQVLLTFARSWSVTDQHPE